MTVRGWRLLVAALIGIIALVLTAAVTVAPRAGAQESEDPTSAAQDRGYDSSDLTNVTGLDDESTTDENGFTVTGDDTEADNEVVEGAESEVPEADSSETAAPRAGPQADDNIVVDVISIENVPNPGEQLKVGEKAEVSGTWTAPNGASKGDTFTVGFPAELRMPAGMTFALIGDGEFAGQTVGTCAVSGENTFTCTLTAEFNGLDEVGGTWFIEATASKFTAEENVDFTVPMGGTVTVPLPGDNGGISDGQSYELSKSAKVNPDKSSIKWTVQIPGSMLSALDPDGTGKVTLQDKLPDGLRVCSPSRAKLEHGRANLTEIPGGLALEEKATGTVPVTIDAGAAFNDNERYVLTYNTCTTDGSLLEAGKEYENSFIVDGQHTATGIGKGEPWAPQELAKSGSVVNSLDKVNWTVTIPGDMVNQDGSVEFSDEFTGDTFICDGGVNLTVEKSTDRIQYPNTGRTWDTVAAGGTGPLGSKGDKSFSTKLTGLTKDEDAVYRVTYQTCLDKIPDRGQKFKNSATVNGNPVATTSNAPSPSSSKKGSFNTEPVTVDGVEYPAGTTQTWTVNLSGYDLETKLEDGTFEPAKVLEASDVFSDTMAVCSDNTDLVSALGMTVKSTGVGNYGTAGMDLTENTTVTRTDNGFSLKTTPGDEKDFSRARNYTITYTTCTASGGQDAAGTRYENTVTVNGKEFESHVDMNWNAGGTGTGVSRGSFSLVKSATTSSEKFDENAEFTVKVEEFASQEKLDANEPENTYDVKVKADGTPVSGHYTRGNGWLIRLTETGFPSDAGVLWEPGTFVLSPGVTTDDQGRAIVAITPKSNVEVQLNNTATLGELIVRKVVEGDAKDAAAGADFKVTAHIDSDGDGEQGSRDEQFTLKDGESYTLKDLPIGAVVTFDESLPANTDQVTWGTPKFDPSSVTVGKDTNGSLVTLTNTADTTYGTFSLKKDLKGSEANNAAVPDSFTVTATWKGENGENRSKELTLPKDGTVVPFGESLRAGTQVYLNEDLASGQGSDGVVWSIPAFSGDGVTSPVWTPTYVSIGKDPSLVTVTNVAEKSDGTFRIIKTVSGEAADQVPDDAQFTVHAKWKDGDKWVEKDITVGRDYAVDLGEDLPYGTEVTLTETRKPDVAGVEWGSVTWGTADEECVVNRTMSDDQDADGNSGSWLETNPDGSATGIISDNPWCGRLITLTNEAKHSLGKVEFEKQIVTKDGDTISVAETVKKGLLPDTVSFDVTVKGVDVPSGQTAPEGAVKAGDTVTLNKDNNWKWTSGDLPKDTVVTFDEVTPAPLAGVDWAKPLFDKDSVTVEGGKTVTSQIRNTFVPTTAVDVEKTVTGPLAKHLAKKTTFEVTASWTDADGFDKTCVFTVKNGQSAVPTGNCDATVIDGKVYFPQGTEITFEETGASEESRLLTWKDVKWTVKDGDAKLESEDKGDRFPTIATVTLKGDSPVAIGLENESSSDGIIIIPIIPTIPVVPPTIPVTPTQPGNPVNPETPTNPVTPTQPGTPVNPKTPINPVDGTPGHPGQPMPEQSSSPSSGGGLADTGASVIGLASLALILIGGGSWLALRHRRNDEA